MLYPHRNEFYDFLEYLVLTDRDDPETLKKLTMSEIDNLVPHFEWTYGYSIRDMLIFEIIKAALKKNIRAPYLNNPEFDLILHRLSLIRESVDKFGSYLLPRHSNKRLLTIKEACEWATDILN